MELVSRAMEFAIEAHDGMRRKKQDIPFILHPMEVASIVSSLTTNQEVIAAAVLHDVVEDTPTTIEDITRIFGERVATLVQAETENKRRDLPPEATWRIRKEESIAYLKSTKDLEAKMVFIGDKLANMRSFYMQWMKEGDAMWTGFHEQDPKQHAWYYREIAENTREFEDSLAWKEYNMLVHMLFEEGEKL